MTAFCNLFMERPSYHTTMMCSRVTRWSPTHSSGMCGWVAHTRTPPTAMSVEVAAVNRCKQLITNRSVRVRLTAGRSGLAVACLTAVRKVLGSNHSVGSCVCSKNHCDLQPWARAVCTFPAVPRSTQPSTLRGMVNEYQLSG